MYELEIGLIEEFLGNKAGILPFRFSTTPFCQGEWGLQKKVSAGSA